MKVLHLAGAMEWGGGDQQMMDLIANLSDLDIQSVILCFNHSAIKAHAEKHGVSTLAVDKSKRYSSKVLRYIKEQVQQLEIDVIHIHTSNFVMTYMLADVFYKLKVPAVFSKKSISESSSLLSPVKYNYKGIKKIVCVSNAILESFKKTIKPGNRHKLVTVYDGIRLDKKFPPVPSLRETFNLPAGITIVGNIANHYLAKDIGVFVKTANHLVNELQRKDLFFVQIGSPSPYTPEYEALVDEYNLRDSVKMMGFTPNAGSYLPQFDIFLMTSQREGLPLVIMEAFNARVPVVSTSGGGIPEAITHEENGLLSPVKDHVSLAGNIIALQADGALKQKLVENAYKRLHEEFDSITCARKMAGIYAEVTGNKN